MSTLLKKHLFGQFANSGLVRNIRTWLVLYSFHTCFLTLFYYKKPKKYINFYIQPATRKVFKQLSQKTKEKKTKKKRQMKKKVKIHFFC